MAGRTELPAEHDAPCACDHPRSAHVDYAQACDVCPCRSFDGRVFAETPPYEPLFI